MIKPDLAYMFDTHGFGIIRNMLSPESVTALRDVLLAGRTPATLPWRFPILHRGRPVWDALMRPDVMEIAERYCGPGFRLDHAFALSSNDSTIQLHGGRDCSQLSCFCHEIGQGNMLVGQLIIGFCLAAQSPQTGGLCYIPGSHRAADRREGKHILADVLKGNFRHPAVIIPTLKPGDVVVFSESIIHGDSGWTGSAEPRLQVYYRFSPGWLGWRDPREQTKYLAYATTDQERRLLAGPWVGQYNDDNDTMDKSVPRRPPTIGPKNAT